MQSSASSGKHVEWCDSRRWSQSYSRRCVSVVAGRASGLPSRCGDYGASFAHQLAARFPRPDQIRTLPYGGEGRCLLIARSLKLPSNPTDAQWKRVLKALNPPAVVIRRTVP